MSFVDGSSFSYREACLPVDEGATRYGGLEKGSKKKTSKAVFPVFVLISSSEELTIRTMRIFYINLTVSILLIVGGFLVPPVGIIDGSVLTAVGLLIMFSVIEKIPEIVKAGKSVKLSKGDSSVEITTRQAKEPK